jgi:hypothetical protein
MIRILHRQNPCPCILQARVIVLLHIYLTVKYEIVRYHLLRDTQGT